MMEAITDPATWIIAAVVVGIVIWKVAKWAGAVDARMESHGAFMKEVRTDIEDMPAIVSGQQTAASGSPLQLIDLGKATSEEIDARPRKPLQLEELSAFRESMPRLRRPAAELLREMRDKDF